MDDYIARTVKAYDDVSTYENSTKLLIPEQELNEFLKQLKSGMKILDAGCAFGRDSRYMKDKGFIVSGIDLSEALVIRAQEIYPDIVFAKKDVRDTGFESDFFDGIW